MTEVTYGTGRERKAGTRKGYGQQKPDKGKRAPEAEESGARRKQALDRILADAKVRTGTSMATTAASMQAVGAAQRGAVLASSMVGALQAPNIPKGPWGGSQPVSGHGAAARLARNLGQAQGIKGVARRVERAGYTVNELEGYGGTGQVSSGHTDNSQHYSGTAMDITGPKLKVLFKAMQLAFGGGMGGVTREAYGGHSSHLHSAFVGRQDLRLTENIHDPVGYYWG